MKKSLLFLTMLLSFTSFSQNRFAVFAGASNSTFSEGFLENVAFNKAIGFHFGGLYEFQFNDKIAFRPKLVFSMQGDREETKHDAFNLEIVDYKLNYLNIPMNFKFFSKPYIIIGPQIGFLLSTKKGERDYGDVENKIDYGLNGGIGYDFNHFFIEFNMYQGLNTVIEIEYVGGGKREATNTVMQLTLGYYFN